MIAPERLLRALLQLFYSIRSGRMLIEQPNSSCLFRCFVGLDMDEPVCNHAVFSKNRGRISNRDLARSFFKVIEQARGHLSDKHFPVDGTFIEAWASQKILQKKDGSDDGNGANFHGHQRRIDTHQSKTDPEAKLYRKDGGQEVRLSYLGHVLIERFDNASSLGNEPLVLITLRSVCAVTPQGTQSRLAPGSASGLLLFCNNSTRF